MTEIEKWIEEASEENALNLSMLTSLSAAEVVNAIKGRFVKGNPRVWWLSLQTPFTSVSSVGVNIADIVPTRNELVYLIPETEAANLPVYHVKPGDIEVLRRECPPFEYYVTDDSLEWLLIETDHDEFIIAYNIGQPTAGTLPMPTSQKK